MLVPVKRMVCGREEKCEEVKPEMYDKKVKCEENVIWTKKKIEVE